MEMRTSDGESKRNRGLHLLRVAYWVGAVFDAAMLPPMLHPPLGGAMFGIADFHPGPEYRYAMYVGAALMAGWTALLLWADRKPVERRGVILLTIIPVIAGMIAASLYSVASGLVTAGGILPILVLQVSLTAFFLGAYIHSRPRPPST
jgi:hypothetical protein